MNPSATPASPQYRTGAVAALLVAAIAVPVWFFWSLPILPFTDLPNHLTEAYVCGRHAARAGAIYHPALTAYQPSYLHAVFCAQFTRVETGNAIFYSLYALLLPFGMLALIRQIRGEPFFALLSVCWLYSVSVGWGFSGFTLAIPLVLFGLWAHCAFLSTRKTRWLVASAMLALAVYYAHVLAFLFLGAVLVTATVWLSRVPWRIRLLALGALMPSGLICLCWIAHAEAWSQGESTAGFLLAYYRHDYFSSLCPRVGHLLTDDNRILACGAAGVLLALIWTVPLLCGVLHWLGRCMRLVSQMSPATPRAAASVEPADMQSAGGVAYAVARACLFVALGCVLGLPNNLPGQWCLYYRFGVFFWLAAIWIASRNARALQHPWRLRIAILVAVGLHTSLWGDYFSAFNRQIAQPFATVLHRADLRGHSLAAMIGDDAFRGQRHALVHLQNYQMVWNDGLAPTMSAEYRFGLLRASAATPMPAYAENVADVAAVPELLDRYAHMDFLLLHGARVVEAVTAATNLTRVAEAGGWVLLRRAAPAIATVTRTDAPAAAAQP